MRICQDHWDRLRAKIDERGLSHLIAADGPTAVAQISDQLERDEVSAANFDPLMAAFWGIGSNVMRLMSQAGVNPLYLLGSGPEDEVGEQFGPEAKGRTWPRCGLCYIGLAHELTCHDARCMLPKQDGYAWMLDRAADDSKAKAIELGLVEA